MHFENISSEDGSILMGAFCNSQIEKKKEAFFVI